MIHLKIMILFFKWSDLYFISTYWYIVVVFLSDDSIIHNDSIANGDSMIHNDSNANGDFVINHDLFPNHDSMIHMQTET